MAQAAQNCSDSSPDTLAVAVAADRGTTAAELAAKLATKLPAEGLSAILVFVSAYYDAADFAAAMASHYPKTPIYGCTTAGELAPSGLEENSAVALGFRASDFSVVAEPILDLEGFTSRKSDALAAHLRASVGQTRVPEHLFGILLIDGLSRHVETIISRLSSSFGDLPIVGGSAADQLRFEKTWIICNGEAHPDAAILLLMATSLPFVAFKSDQFEPTSAKLVITEADLERRCVKELNAEAAAQEYAENFGVSTSELDIDAFALHPLVVKVGADHYARSIHKVDQDGSLHFCAAIDEGLVLTGATRGDSVASLNDLFRKTEAEIGEVSLYLGFDCVMRRIDAERHQRARELSELYRRHHVIGFNTYGEQFHAMHLNETFTGIAIGRRRLSA